MKKLRHKKEKDLAAKSGDYDPTAESVVEEPQDTSGISILPSKPFLNTTLFYRSSWMIKVLLYKF